MIQSEIAVQTRRFFLAFPGQYLFIFRRESTFGLNPFTLSVLHTTQYKNKSYGMIMKKSDVSYTYWSFRVGASSGPKSFPKSSLVNVDIFPPPTIFSSIHSISVYHQSMSVLLLYVAFNALHWLAGLVYFNELSRTKGMS